MSKGETCAESVEFGHDLGNVGIASMQERRTEVDRQSESVLTLCS